MIKRQKFVEPTGLAGDWFDQREVCFRHEGNPFAARYAIEKMTGMLLARDPADTERLSYCGSTRGNGDPHEIRLRFEAVIGDHKFYSLTVKRTAPRKWITEEAFLKSAARAFAFWCLQLQVVPWSELAQPAASLELMERYRRESIELEEAAARVVEDPAPIEAVQREVLDAVRAGMGFFTASKEGGTHIYFDGKTFVRSDYGDEPLVHETYADDASMIAALRRFFDWDAGHATYPHKPPELNIWKYIQGRLLNGKR